MKKWRIFLILFLAIIVLLPHESVLARTKTVSGHTIFSENEIEKRIRKIKDYYYNNQKALKIRNRIKGGCNVTYYIHGKDLLFAYGVAGTTEYRMYFYKNQLIRLLVDENGKERKTYQQLYKKLGKVYNKNVYEYMWLENYARQEMAYTMPINEKVIKNETVLISKISGNYIIYHTFKSYDPYGELWSISKEAYKTKVSSKVQVLDRRMGPDKYEKHNLSWLKKQALNDGVGEGYLYGKEGRVYKIELPYNPGCGPY